MVSKNSDLSSAVSFLRGCGVQPCGNVREAARKLKLEDALKSSLLAEHPLSWVCVGETLEDAVSGSVTPKSTLQVSGFRHRRMGPKHGPLAF